MTSPWPSDIEHCQVYVYELKKNITYLFCRRWTSHTHRYAVLAQGDSEDRLLGDDNDDDDDPPLDLNPDRGFSGGRLAMDDDDDRSDLFQPS